MAFPTLQQFANNLVVRKADYRLSGTFVDENYLLNMFGEDMRTTSLGVLSTWNQWSWINTPLLKMTELEKNTIYTKTDEGRLTFAMPYQIEGATIKEDTTEDVNYPGRDGQTFDIILGDGGLNPNFAVGDRITARFRKGAQNLYVVAVDSAAGQGFKYKVTLVTDNKDEWYDKSLLAVGTQYYKISGTVGEFTEQFGGIDAGAGLMKLEHYLGGRRGVEYSITGNANRLSMNSLRDTTSGKDFVSGFLASNSNLLSPTDPGFFMVMGEGVRGANGELVTDGGKKPLIKKGTESWMTMIDALLLMQLYKDEERDLMWAKGGVITGANNKSQFIGEGLYPQLRRGNVDEVQEYSIQRLINTFGQVFRNRSDIPDTKRYFTLQGGRGAVNQIQRIFNEISNTTANQLGLVLQAKDMGIIKGDPMDLEVGFKFGRVFIQGFGWLKIEYNPAFDAQLSRSEDMEIIDGLPKYSYTSAIFDVTDDKSTNAAEVTSNVQYAKGFNNGANVFLVRNESMPGVAVNYVAGRNSSYAPTMGKGKVASSRAEKTTIMMENASNIFLADPTRSLLFELK